MSRKVLIYCDVCGDLITGEIKGVPITISVYDSVYFGVGDSDLCAECYGSLIKTLVDWRKARHDAKTNQT